MAGRTRDSPAAHSIALDRFALEMAAEPLFLLENGAVIFRNRKFLKLFSKLNEQTFTESPPMGINNQPQTPPLNPGEEFRAPLRRSNGKVCKMLKLNTCC
jgi:hypothetical protein